MDHLPYPNSYTIPPLEVPYICHDYHYDGEGLEDFAIRQGWQTSDGEWLETDTYRFAQRLQAWLFFGVLQEVFAKLYSRDLFIKQMGADNREYVSMKEFPKLARQIIDTHGSDAKWMSLLSSLWLNDSTLAGSIGRARQHCQRISLNDELGRLVLFSIRMLFWSLEAEQEAGSSPGKSKFYQSGQKFVAERMIAGGWCRYRVGRLKNRGHPDAVLYYLAAIPRSALEPLHLQCDKNACKAEQVDMKTYQPRHRTKDCKCAMVGPSEERLHSLIRNGSVPLVGARPRNDSREIELAIAEAGFDTPYVAISHVWLGGLGNVESNSLPCCQLRFLQRAIGACKEHSERQDNAGSEKPPDFDVMLHSGEAAATPEEPGSFQQDLWFWMDTLCIPRRHLSLRRQAIIRMARIYGGARSVLVVDPTLIETNIVNESECFVAALVQSSSWMHRCWTFQEACLSRDINFIFKDATLRVRLADLDKLSFRWNQAAIKESQRVTLNQVFQSGIQRLMPPIPAVAIANVAKDSDNANADEAPWTQIIDIWNELSRRETTKPEDIYTIFAVLLGCNAAEIQTLPEEERLKAVLRAQPILPLSLLFQGAQGIPVDDGNCKWVPKFPKGHLSTEHSSMAWDESRNALRFSLKESVTEAWKYPGSRAVILTKSRVGARIRRCYKLAVFEGNEIHRTVELEPIDAQKHIASPDDEMYCVALYNYRQDLRDEQHRQVGALLKVREWLSEDTICVEYLCSLRYTEVNSNRWRTIDDVLIGKLHTDLTVLLDCGKFLNVLLG